MNLLEPTTMQPRDPKTPDEIRAMSPGELLDYVKRPTKPVEGAHHVEARRCEQHGVYLWPEGVECPACVHAERDALRGMSSEFGAALIAARARVAELETRLSSLDCRYAGGGVAEVSGSHCPADIPCDRCMAEHRVAELEEGISTAMQLIEGGFDSAAYEALEALNAHK